MTRGQRDVLKLKPGYSFAQKGCKFKPPPGHAADADFVHDMQLVNFYPASKIKLADEEGDVIKRPLAEVASWETPRAPFEVCTVNTYVACMSGSASGCRAEIGSPCNNQTRTCTGCMLSTKTQQEEYPLDRY